MDSKIIEYMKRKGITFESNFGIGYTFGTGLKGLFHFEDSNPIKLMSDDGYDISNRIICLLNDSWFIYDDPVDGKHTANINKEDIINMFQKFSKMRTPLIINPYIFKAAIKELK